MLQHKDRLEPCNMARIVVERSYSQPAPTETRRCSKQGLVRLSRTAEQRGSLRYVVDSATTYRGSASLTAGSWRATLQQPRSSSSRSSSSSSCASKSLAGRRRLFRLLHCGCSRLSMRRDPSYIQVYQLADGITILGEDGYISRASPQITSRDPTQPHLHGRQSVKA